MKVKVVRYFIANCISKKRNKQYLFEYVYSINRQLPVLAQLQSLTRGKIQNQFWIKTILLIIMLAYITSWAYCMRRPNLYSREIKIAHLCSFVHYLMIAIQSNNNCH